jgi:hypothetical protein
MGRLRDFFGEGRFERRHAMSPQFRNKDLLIRL